MEHWRTHAENHPQDRGVGEPCHDKQWYGFDAAATNKLGQPATQTDFLEEYLTFI